MIEAVKRIAVQAGDILMKHYHADYRVDMKSDATPCTIADREANAFIVSALKQLDPAAAVCAEESADDASRLRFPRVWFVDPLDGTTQFIKKTKEFCVMIGLAVDGRPELGVVYVPARDELFWAERGKGAFLRTAGGTRRLSVRALPAWRGIAMVIRGNKNNLLDTVVGDALGIGNRISIGSTGLKLLALASGTADLYVNVDPHAAEWDSCAPHIILEEAGGTITDFRGRPIVYNQRADTHLIYRLLASSHPDIHARALVTIRLLMDEKKLPFAV